MELTLKPGRNGVPRIGFKGPEKAPEPAAAAAPQPPVPWRRKHATALPNGRIGKRRMARVLMMVLSARGELACSCRGCTGPLGQRRKTGRVPRSVRDRVLARAAYVCRYCGGRAGTVDHAQARAYGGCNGVENLVPCCGPCNVEKGSMTAPWPEAHACGCCGGWKSKRVARCGLCSQIFGT